MGRKFGFEVGSEIMGDFTLTGSFTFHRRLRKGFDDPVVIHLFEKVHTLSRVRNSHHMALSARTETTGLTQAQGRFRELIFGELPKFLERSAISFHIQLRIPASSAVAVKHNRTIGNQQNTSRISKLGTIPKKMVKHRITIFSS